MGNFLGGSKSTTKIMNIKGETTKHKTPIQAIEITKQHPGHVLLDSDAVNRYGIKAQPLDPTRFLEAKKVYLLVELPKFPLGHNPMEPRRVRSSGGIHVSAKDRLESLMLSRRTVSDLSAIKPTSGKVVEGPTTVRMRLPKAEVERLVKESKDKAEAAEKIVGLCMGKTGTGTDTDTDTGMEAAFGLSGQWEQQQVPQPREEARREKSHPALRRVRDGYNYKKRVGFLPVNEGEIHQVVLAS